MESSSGKNKEEEVGERSRRDHPCHFVEEAVRALLKCLGIEISTTNSGDTKKEDRASSHHLNKPPQYSDAELDSPPISSNSQEAAADPPSQNIIDNASLVTRGSSRRPGLSQGHGPQHN